MLKIYNTLTRQKEEFKPIEPGKVGLYACGPTVYNFAHIGNLRTYVFEDILKRTLHFCGYQVNHVMNVTDVGHLTSDSDVGKDKMEEGAQREGKTVWEIADYYWSVFKSDLNRLNILPPSIWCKATDHIPEQIAQVQALQDKGYTYIIEGDGVYYDTSKFPEYGKLTRQNLEDLKAGARVEMVAGKRNVTDFALWKFSPQGSQRLMEWDSPWGKGFPGWHIECSAMAIKYLGDRLDVHCGGVDHIPIHHTNEIAQAEAVLGHAWVNWWVHGEFLTIAREGGAEEKMAKSSGEFLTLDRLVEKGFDPLAYRFFLLGGHYRQHLAFSLEGLQAATNAFKRLKGVVLEAKSFANPHTKPSAECLREFRDAVEDDLNMPRALASLWNAQKTIIDKSELYATLLAMDEILGLDMIHMKPAEVVDLNDELAKLISERELARKNKDFKKSDQIRDELLKKGIALKDNPDGTTTWSVSQ